MNDPFLYSGWTNFNQELALSVEATRLGYEAAETSNRRKTPTLNLGTEDRVLDRNKRRRLLSNTRDIRRNFALAAWIIRKHLDYVASFSFQMRTDDEDFDKLVEKKMRRWSKPEYCDVSARFSLRKMIRMTEAKSVVDGDAGLLKVSRNQKGRRISQLQGIEGDRVKDPDQDQVKKEDTNQWVQGIKVDEAYRHLSYAIHKRVKRGRSEVDRIVPAANMIWHNGFVDNFDQVRGISPLAAALNQMRDLYEGFDYALGRMKIDQLFGIKITRDATILEDEENGSYGQHTSASTGKAFDEETVEEADDSPQYDVDFGKGPVALDMDPGHDANFMESAQPSDQFRNFSMAMIQLSLKSLDIPYSFYSEDFTNFFGSRGALQHYERSCRDRRETLQLILDQVTRFMVMTWILEGSIALPAGMKLSDLIWEWIPDGIPWWDPAKEIKGDVMAIGAGLDTPQRICKERGRGDFFANIDAIAKARQYAEEKGVPVSFSVEPGDKEEKDDDDDSNKKNND